MDTNAIILILAGLVVFGLIYRSVSSKPEKKTKVGAAEPAPSPRPEPSPASVPEISEPTSQDEMMMKSTRAELVLMAEEMGLTVPKSYTKTRIVRMILSEARSLNSTN